MSTELVAIERITIRKGDSSADDIRSCLAHYLLQFINSASIESLSMHKLSIKVDGKTALFVQEKTGGVGLKGLDTDWQHTPEMSAILDRLVTDVDVEVFLSYEMIHFFSTENFYGYNFWSEVLQEYGCEAVRYKGLEYYDVESNVVMLSFDGKQLCDNPDYVPESAVKDIHKWFCYTFEMSLEPDTPFNAAQVDKMLAAIESVHGVFGREEDDVADVGGGLPVHLHRRDADRQGGPAVCCVPAGNVGCRQRTRHHARLYRRVHPGRDGDLCSHDDG